MTSVRAFTIPALRDAAEAGTRATTAKAIKTT
jgi:hypothetical protein